MYETSGLVGFGAPNEVVIEAGVCLDRMGDGIHTEEVLMWLAEGIGDE
jgi:hypothetical protein